MAVALGTTAPAEADEEVSSRQQQNYWGAIAISIDGAYGTSWDYATKKAALKRSKAECKDHSDLPGKCANVVYTVNGCAAVSVKFNSKGLVRKYGYAYGDERDAVVRAAQRRCVKAYGKKCKRLTSVCTARP
jgi:hypothetical protein